jgi:predicted Zn-dependent protease
MMKIKIYIFGIILLILYASTSCSGKLYPSIDREGKIISYDTATFSYFYGEALKQKLMGNAGDAIKYLEQCIKINPVSDAAYYQIAQISVQHGDFENGKIFASKAVMIDSMNLWYLTMLGDIYFQEKNLDSAVVYYEKAVKEFPDKDQVKLNLSSLYIEKSEFDKAAGIYKDLEGKYGTGGNITLLAIKNLINAKKLDEAEIRVRNVLKDNPDNLIYNGILAEIYKNRGDRKRAELTYQRLMSIDSLNLQTVISLIDFYVDGKEYTDFFKLVNDIVIDNQFSRDDMMSIFQKILEYNDLIKERGIELEIVIRVLEGSYENDGIIMMIRPELYQKEGKDDLAAERLEELLKNYPDNYYIWERLLLIYSEMRNYNRLFVLGKECSTKFNMSYVAKVLYASAAMEKKEYNIAIEELEKAKILAGNQDEMISQVLSMEADVYYRKKEFLKSFELYKTILKNNPEDIIILNNYAYFLAEQNQDLKEAERMIRIVVEKENVNGTYLDTYAWILYKRGKFKEAEKVMEDLMEKDKNEDSEWFEHYGYIMKALKKCDTAVDYWEKAYRLNGGKEYLKLEIEKCTK